MEITCAGTHEKAPVGRIIARKLARILNVDVLLSVQTRFARRGPMPDQALAIHQSKSARLH